MTIAQTMFDKIWEKHVAVQREGEALLYIDRNFVHEGSFHAFADLKKEGLQVRKPRQSFAVADHYVGAAGRLAGFELCAPADMNGF